MAEVTFNVDLHNLFLAGYNSHVGPSSFSNPFAADSFSSLLAGSDYPELIPNSNIIFRISPASGNGYESQIIAVKVRTTGPNPELIQENPEQGYDVITAYNNFYSKTFIIEDDSNIALGMDGSFSAVAENNQVLIATNNYNDNQPEGPADYFFNYTVLFSVIGEITNPNTGEPETVIQYFSIDPIYRVTRRGR